MQGRRRSRGGTAAVWMPMLAALATASAGHAQEGAAAPDTAGKEATASRARYRVGVDYSHVRFDTMFTAWDLATGSLSRKSDALTAIASVNYAHRFDRSALQWEGELYPKFGKMAYAYLDAAYSADAAFPRWRGGAELYVNLPQAWEASGGWRQLHFTETDVRIFTGSVGKYAGPYYASLRPYFSRTEGETGRSVFLTVRKYGETADDFEGVTVGYGSTPLAVSTLAEVRRGNTFHADLAVQRPVSDRVALRYGFEWEREKLPTGGTRKRTGFTLGLRRDL
jgi:YaiO family outer membrane protein